MTEVGLGLLGLVLLVVYFRAVHTRWPLSYFPIADLTGYRVSAGPLRYITFRFLPVMAVAFFVATLSTRSDANTFITLGLLATGHVILSSGRGLLALIRDGRTFARVTQAVLHVAVGLASLLAVFVGGAIAGIEVVRRIVPEGPEVSAAMWTAVLAAVGGAYILRATQGRSVDTEELMKNSRQKLGEELWRAAEETGSEFNADTELVRAILLTENLQRPAWTRRLERLKGRVWPPGTYGIMQVKSERPLSDEESLRQAVANRLGDTRDLLRGEDGYEAVEEILKRYNPSPEFFDIARAFYFALADEAGTLYEEDKDEEDREEDFDEVHQEDWRSDSRAAKSFLAGVGGGLAVAVSMVVAWAVARRFMKRE